MRLYWIVGLLLMTACSKESPPAVSGEAIFDSPKACFEEAIKALEARDVNRFFACLTPRGQAQAAGSTQIMLLGMARRDRSKSQEIFAFINEHGLPLDEEGHKREDLMQAFFTGDGGKLMELVGQPIKNKADFVKGSLSFGQPEANSPTDPWDGVMLGEVAESDSKAVAKLVTDDPDVGPSKLHFSKVNGSWLIDRLDVTMPAMGAPPKPVK